MFIACSTRTMANARAFVQEPPEPRYAPPRLVEAPKRDTAPWHALAPMQRPVLTPAQRRLPRWAVEMIADIAEKHGVTPSDIMAATRRHKVVAARNEVFYLLKITVSPVTGKTASYPKVAEWMCREHTGVLYGAAKHAMLHGLPSASNFGVERKITRSRESALKWNSANRGQR